MRRFCALFCVAVCLALPSSSRVAARQQGTDPAYEARGFQPGRDYYAPLPFEHIDTINGNVFLTFTDLVLPGNGGFDLRFERSYNSKNTRWTWGFSGVPMTVAPTDPIPGSEECGYPEDGSAAFMPTFQGADGADHRTMNVSFTGDLVTNRFWSYDAATRTLRLPNGLTAEFDHLTSYGTCGEQMGSLTRVTDAFGNEMRFFYTGGQLTLVEQDLGNSQVREVTISYHGNGAIASLTSEGRTWEYEYGFDPAGHPRLTEVTPPEPPSWSFSYTGFDLTGIATPNGGTVSYAFGTHSFWREALGHPRVLVPTKVLQSRTTGGRAVEPGTWTFAFDSTDDNLLTVTGPAATVVYRSGITAAGHPVTVVRETRDGSTVVQTETITYGEILLGGPQPQYQVPLIEARTIVRDGRSYATDYQYRGSPAADYGRVDYGAPYRIEEMGDLTRTTAITYDHLLQPYALRLVRTATTTVVEESATRSYTYDSSTGFRESATIYGVTTTYAPDARGNVRTATDAHGHETTFTYAWGVLKNTTTGEYAIAREVDPDGTVASETRRNHTTMFDYDDLGRQTQVDPPIGYSTVTDYADDGVTVTVTRGIPAASTTSTLDGFGRVIATVTSGGVQTRMAYDAEGRKSYESLPYTSSDVGTSFTYDVLGRLRQATSSDGATVGYAYANGVDVTMTDQESRVTVQNWSAFGDPDEPRLMGLVDAAGQSWSYAYNALGRLTRVDQPGGLARTWTYYPGTDRLASELHPESGATSFTYDGAGRLETRSTPRGSFTFGYDANDRLTSIDAPGSGHDVTFAYDDSDNRTLLENGTVRRAFGYDAANRLEWRKDTIAGEPERQTTFAYSDWDDLEGVTYPSGQSVTYTYDVDRRVTSVRRGGAALAEVTDYHPSGAIARLRMGNGLEETFTFHPQRYWLTTISGGPLSVAYGHDAVGNVKTVTDARPGLSQGFEYDALDRLWRVTGFGATDYTYDAEGNRKTKTSASVVYSYDPATNRLASASGPLPNPEIGSYGYHASGDLETDPSGSYSYTPFNMLATATINLAGGGQRITAYGYDGDQQRTTRRDQSGNQDLFYHGPGGQLLSEFRRDAGSASARWVRDYVYLGGRTVTGARVRAWREGGVVWIEAIRAVTLPGGFATETRMVERLSRAADGTLHQERTIEHTGQRRTWRSVYEVAR